MLSKKIIYVPTYPKYIYICACVRAFVRACVRVCVRACVYVCVTRVRTHTRAHTQPLPQSPSAAQAIDIRCRPTVTVRSACDNADRWLFK